MDTVSLGRGIAKSHCKGYGYRKGPRIMSPPPHLLHVRSFSHEVAVSSNFLSWSSCFDVQKIMINHTYEENYTTGRII